MTASLPLFHTIAGTRVVVTGDGDAAAAKRRLVMRAGGHVCGEAEAHYARLAFVAFADEKSARKAALRLRRMGLLVNVADRPDLCDFTVPSILERDPVLIAVGTGGASAGLAKHLRLRLERLLPQSLGALARKLSASRAVLHERWPDSAERRRALDLALEEGGVLDPLDPDASAQAEHWIGAGTRETDNRNQRFEITLRSNDPDDLTLREARMLGRADCIIHAPGIAPVILARARADAARLVLEPGEFDADNSADNSAAHPAEKNTIRGLTVIIRP